MRKWIAHAFAGAAALALATAPAFAQEEAKPEKREADYKEVVFVKYKPGMEPLADEIIENHFKKASEAAGVAGPMEIHLQTGPWDKILVWGMKEGPAAMEWTRSPEELKWWSALVKQAGGEEAAEAIMQRYMDTVETSQMNLGHIHK